MEIVLQPVLTDLDNNTLNNLGNGISREFENTKVTVSSATNNPNLMRLKKDITFQSSFDKHRNQWYSPKLLVWFFEKFRPNKDTKILFMLDADAYSGGLNYVLGEAYPKGGLGIIYLPRIRQEFYGLKPDNKLFFERMVKESVHELGHVFGFSHCKNLQCVMHFSNTLKDTDSKMRRFCGTCRMKKLIF
jgi:archaemetzincin